MDPCKEEKDSYIKWLEHKNNHIELHNKLDELVADYISHSQKTLTNTSVLDLMIWSYSQVLNPT